MKRPNEMPNEIIKSNRRSFLAQTAAASLGFSLAPALGIAAEAKTAIGFAFSLYGMKSLKLAEALRACSKIGYDGVELTLTPGWHAEPKLLSQKRRRELRSLLESLGLKLPGLMENIHLNVENAKHRANLDRLKAAAELARDLSPKQPPVIETVLGGRPGQWESIKDAMALRLVDWTKIAEEMKITLALKAHVSGAVHTPQAALWLMRQADSPQVRLNYDYSHFQLRKIPLVESLKLMLPHTVFIHIKDSRGDAKNVRFLLPGEGDTNYRQYLALLKKSAYRGFVCVEVSGQIHGKKGYDPVETARRCYRTMAPIFAQAGIQRR